MKSALQQFVKRIRQPAKDRPALHEYWRNPDAGNLPTDYLDGAERSAWLAEVIDSIVEHDAGIVELGCNVGRNLNALWERGFRELTGVEINQAAVQLMSTTFPQLQAEIRVGSIEEHIKSVDGELLFTMAVLEHLHPDSEWVFEEIARFPYVLTVEDEREVSERHFPRDYGRIFTRLGKKELRSELCSERGIEGYRLRVFA